MSVALSFTKLYRRKVFLFFSLQVTEKLLFLLKTHKVIVTSVSIVNATKINNNKFPSNQPETKLYHTFITIAYIVFSLAYIPNTMSAQTESIPARVAPQNSQSASNGTEISEKHVFGPADKKANGIVGPPMRPLVRRPTPMNLKIPPGLIKKGLCFLQFCLSVIFLKGVKDVGPRTFFF